MPLLPEGGRAPVAAILLTLMLVAPSAASAQTFRGLVLGPDSEPVATALVRLEDGEGAQLAFAVTDSTGLYEVRAPEPGEYVLVAERLGYEPFRSHPLAVENADGVYPVDIVMRAAPLPIAGIDVRADRLESIERGIRASIGRNPRTLRTTPFFRPAIEEHLAKAHRLSDMIRWANIPSITVKRTSAGPCFQYRNRHCLPVYLNEQRMEPQWTDALPLEMAETVVVVLPLESVRFEGGAVLLYTPAWVLY